MCVLQFIPVRCSVCASESPFLEKLVTPSSTCWRWGPQYINPYQEDCSIFVVINASGVLCVYTCVCLQDFRNYQYTLPVVRGLVVDMEVRKTCIKIPSNRYNEVNGNLPTSAQCWAKTFYASYQSLNWNFNIHQKKAIFILVHRVCVRVRAPVNLFNVNSAYEGHEQVERACVGDGGLF